MDTNILRGVYGDMSHALEYWVNSITKKYVFKIMLEGFNTFFDREERLGLAKDLAESGIVMEQKFASAIGMNPFDFRAQMAETKALGFVDSLTPIVKSSQMPKDEQTGRPQKDESSLSESGSETRDSGSNDEKNME